MRDEQDTATPFYGLRRMTAWWRQRGDAVNPTRGGRWLRQLGRPAISPQPRLSQPAAGHTMYPSRWRGVTGGQVHHVWRAEITDSRLQSGLVDLVAVIDGFSRSVLSWAVSIPLDGLCCLEALEQALSGGRPEVFHTDPGAQFTSQEFPERRQKGGVRLSMDGRGRALDNVVVERLWRRVTYEAGYVREYQRVWDARRSLAPYLGFYHEARLHQALGSRTPAAVDRG